MPISHDQLFKELLHTFFPEFLTLFFPHVAAQLELTGPEAVTFLDRELFTDLPRGEQREPDVVAQVQRRDGTPQAVLIHVEVESRRRAEFPARMYDYHCLLRWRRRLHVLPIVLYLAPGAGGLTREQYGEDVLGMEVIRFWYSVVGLPDLEGAEYRAGESALGSALAALMKPGEAGKPMHKALCLLGVARHAGDEARQSLLQFVIESYAKLDENEEREFTALLNEPPLQEVRAMISPYEQRGIERGREEGREEGRMEGILAGKRDMVRQVARARFGSLPESLDARLMQAIDSGEIDRLLDEVLQSPTVQPPDVT
jgi:hypothetical protein